MSRENVEIARRSFDLWLNGAVDSWLDTLDPNVGWDISTHPLPDVPNHGRGRDAFLTDMLATYTSGWNEYSAELTELIDAATGWSRCCTKPPRCARQGCRSTETSYISGLCATDGSLS